MRIRTKSLLLLTILVVIIASLECFADDVKDTEGVEIQMSKEELEAWHEYGKQVTMTCSEIFKLVKNNAFTGNGINENLHCYRTTMGMAPRPWNPFVEPYPGTNMYCKGYLLMIPIGDVEDTSKYPYFNMWYDPEMNSDYFLYGITLEQFNAMSYEQKVKELNRYKEIKPCINCVPISKEDALAGNYTNTSNNANGNVGAVGPGVSMGNTTNIGQSKVIGPTNN